MKLNSITFTLENCETITIDGKYIGHFIVDKIERGVYRLASNFFNKTQTANRIIIEIHKNANKEEDIFGSEKCGKQFVFNRLRQGDITHIDFVLEDENDSVSFSFATDWQGDNERVNDAQKTYESDCGHLYLVIENGKGIEDYFDKEDINDASYMDYRFDLMNVG